MAQKQLRTEIYEAIQPFTFGSGIVQAGHTVVAGHPLLKGRERFFRPWRPTFELEPESVPEPEPAEQPQEPGTDPKE